MSIHPTAVSDRHADLDPAIDLGAHPVLVGSALDRNVARPAAMGGPAKG